MGPPGRPLSVGCRELPGERSHSILRVQEVHDHQVFSDAVELLLLEVPKLEPNRPAGPGSQLESWWGTRRMLNEQLWIAVIRRGCGPWRVEPTQVRVMAETDKPAQSIGPARLLGLDPLTAVLVLTVDGLLFGAEFGTVGTGWLVTGPVGLLVGIASAFAQRYRYGDRWGLAVVKGIVVGILTAIPTPLPSAVTAVLGGAGYISRPRLPPAS